MSMNNFKNKMMKRQTILVLFLLFLTLSVQAQTKHMKFAGIPLAGTIEQFQKKLVAKGFHVQTMLNRQLPVGTRLFKGVFAGKTGNVAVYYDVGAKVVYGAKVYFDSLTSDRARTELDNLKSLLTIKYGEENITDGVDHEGHPTFTVKTVLGSIYCYMMQDASMSSYPYDWSTHAEFSDATNSFRHESNILNDF